MVELRHLRHFIALAEERSFTRAAARELIVQSGLSSSIRALERAVGSPLFVRGTRPVRLTSEGQALLPAARRALDAAEAARQAVRDVREVLSGELRLGTVQKSTGTCPLSLWLADFARAHPGLHLTVQLQPALQLLTMVQSGELDCAFTTVLSGHTTGLDVQPVVAEPLMVACAADHPLATRDELTLDDLDGQRFVDTHAESTTRVQVDALFADAGLTRHIACEVTEWAMVLGLVTAGLGIALVPAGTQWGAPQQATPPRLIPLVGAPAARRVDLVLPRGQDASPAARRFAQYVHRMRDPSSSGGAAG